MWLEFKPAYNKVAVLHDNHYIIVTHPLCLCLKHELEIVLILFYYCCVLCRLSEKNHNIAGTRPFELGISSWKEPLVEESLYSTCLKWVGYLDGGHALGCIGP